MRKEMTYDNFEALCDRLSHAPFQCGNWWPSVEDVKTKLEPDSLLSPLVITVTPFFS